MRSDWENQPTVEGEIVGAYIGAEGMSDMIYVKGIDVAEDVGNLDQVFDDEENPDPNRPFWMIGRSGTLAQHGFEKEADLIGRKCLLYSGGRYDKVAIEPVGLGVQWTVVIWGEYLGMDVEDLIS